MRTTAPHSSYTAKQWRAIRWFMQREKLTPQLSAFPRVRFTTAEGMTVEHHIASLTDWYDADLKRRQREKATDRRKEAKKRKEVA